MIACLALLLVVDRVEDGVAVVELGDVRVDVPGLVGVEEGDRFVVCPLPPAPAVASISAPPERRSLHVPSR